MHTIFSFMFLGLSLAAPIGPINAAQLDKGIRKGFTHAWLLGLGAMCADALLMLLIYFGVIHFLTTPFMKTFLWLFGCFVLMYAGIESLLKAGKMTTLSTQSDETPLKSFVVGFAMAISSPLTILFWLGIYGSVLADMTTDLNKPDIFLHTAAMFLGILIWDMIMSSLASTFRRFLTPKALTIISIVSGMSLITFGLHFGKEAFLLIIS
ncbi:LysE family transporter [Paenibacillus hexagrammi]|uniref:LysE family translocator n=1 Tax=Paenibacillus hexagrammi TaxID=2908839 RepID=A0ABY3SP80_9BACL|nr:LysE family transporter [Paenibacillus sp. YPD9-1]UJF34945.1 LysE family translocator [Paenibacillus sp. YPD9-1]